MPEINWSLLGAPMDIAGSVQASFQQGQAIGMQRRQRNALAGAAQGDPRAMQELAAINPQLAASMEDQAYQRGERARVGEARSALSDVLLSGQRPNAFAGLATTAPAMGPAQNALAPMIGAVPQSPSPRPPAPVSLQPPSTEPRGLPMGRPASIGSMDDLSLPGSNDSTPDAGSAAFQRLARVDPETAFKVRKMDTEQRASVADALGKQMEVGGRVMSAVLAAPVEQQPELYRQMRTELEQSGVIDLPDEWNADAARARMRMGMTVLQAVSSDQRQQTVDWNMEDDELDNARDDRNVTSQVQTRDGQLANARRGQDLSDARGRRGQDMSDARGTRGQDLADERGRRGQDVADVRGRRGQDLADRRGRESASFKGTGGRGRRAGGTSAARIVNPQTGKAMVLRNGQWVPES